MPRVLRSILAIIAAFVAMSVIVIVCTLVCVKALHLVSGHPTPTYLVLNLIYSLAAACFAGWLAAHIAGYKPRTHGLILGGIMLVMSLVSLLHPAPGQSLMYQVFLAIGPPVTAVLGSTLVSE